MRKPLSRAGRRFPTSAAILLLWVLLPGPAAAACTVVDLMPAFWKALSASDPAARMRAAVIDPHPDLYNDNYVRIPTGSKWTDKLNRDKAYVEAHRQEVDATEQYLQARVPGYMEAFRQTFPDYRCDFPFYVGPSFGSMDGSAATVSGQHRIIFAPDVIPRFHKLSELKVLIDHETFHIYHHQRTGVFGATEEATPTVEEGLWTEGLATFVSWRMNPGVSLDTALLQPGIPQGARPHLHDIAADLLEHLEDRSETVYGRFFVAGQQSHGYPSRSGYYVGVLLAQDLSRRYSLRQLAGLKGGILHEAIVAGLRKLQSAGGGGGRAGGGLSAPARRGQMLLRSGG